jgi:oxygen-independent coproporphyrinogen III oxidase
MTGEDISLYFHIPFCSKKCPYCHFFVLPDEERLKQPFLQALLSEWQLRLPQLQNKNIVSIYFGGGTPTKLDPDHYRLLLQTIFHSVEISPDCEITLEANPEDVDLARMRQFCSLGINRVSLGVQSLNNEELILLGRSHSADKATQAILDTHRAGIENISIDLMFELPTQTLSTWGKSLNALSSLPITHLSLYNLTFEPHTIFFKSRQKLYPLLPSDAVRLQMLQNAIETLTALGLHRYEISAFARRDKQSRHNTGYWTARPFLGFGPSAFSYWDAKRFSNIAHFNKYLTALEQGQLPVDFEEQLPYPRNLQELLAVQLRLIDGVDLNLFESTHGKLPTALTQTLQTLINKGWLTQQESIIKLTATGQLFYDSVATDLI